MPTWKMAGAGEKTEWQKGETLHLQNVIYLLLDRLIFLSSTAVITFNRDSSTVYLSLHDKTPFA